jgi:transcriptional regulator with XRE-family HTH domain
MAATKKTITKPARGDPSPLVKGIAKRLIAMREARGFSRQYLEEQADISSGAISRIEQAKKPELSVAVLLSACRVLECDVGWMITGIVPDGKWKPPPGVR